MKPLASLIIPFLCLLVAFALGWLVAVPPTVTIRLHQEPVTNSLVHVLILTQPSDIGTKQAK